MFLCFTCDVWTTQSHIDRTRYSINAMLTLHSESFFLTLSPWYDCGFLWVKVACLVVTMKLICYLPTDFVVQILGEWLRLRDVCKLDVAMCSTVNRLSLGCVYEGVVLKCNGAAGDIGKTEYQLDWFLVRRIRLSAFRVDYPLSRKALPKVIALLTHSHSHLRTLYLHDVGTSLSSIALCISQYCTGIINLQVANMNICGPFFEMLSNLRQLKNLTIQECEKLNDVHAQGSLCLSVETLTLEGKHCTELQEVLLKMCPNLVTFQLMSEVAELYDMPPKLEELFVDQCKTVRVLNLNSNLRSLVIRGDETKDEDIAGVFTSASHLQYLDLTCNEFLTDVTLNRIADAYSKSLTNLNISGWEGVSCAAIKYLCEKCTKLSSLALGSYYCIIEALDHCSSLRSLDISCCTITDEVLLKIAAAPLEYLNMTRTTGFTNEGLLAFGKGCAKLKTISISSDLLKNLWKELRPDLRIW